MTFFVFVFQRLVKLNYRRQGHGNDFLFGTIKMEEKAAESLTSTATALFFNFCDSSSLPKENVSR